MLIVILFSVATTTRAAAKRDELWARQQASSALITPSALASFPPVVVTSACSQEATPSTLTQTSTSIYSATSTTTVTATNVAVVSQTATTTATITSGTFTRASPIITESTTTTVTSTTTVTYAANAPSATPNYLSVNPDPNAPGAWAISDPSTHLTDNNKVPYRREVFGLTAVNQLYSITNNSYYGISASATAGSTANRLFWSTNSLYGNKTFSGTPLNDGTGRTQVFLKNTATNVNYNFCIANAATNDVHPDTGFHMYFYSTAQPFAINSGQCVTTYLYLSPIANG